MTAPGFSSPAGLAAAAFVVGLSGAMSPGPYLTVTIARTLSRGRLNALLMLVGHALLEAALLAGFALGLQRVLQLPAVETGLALAGGAVIVWMAWGLGRGAWTGEIARDLEAAEHGDVTAGSSRVEAVAAGAVISLSNPYWTLWWATIGAALALQGLAYGPVGLGAFYVGHEIADIAWYGLVISAVSRGRDLLTPRVYRAIMGILACALFYIGVRFIALGFGVDLPWLPF